MGEGMVEGMGKEMYWGIKKVISKASIGFFKLFQDMGEGMVR